MNGVMSLMLALLIGATAPVDGVAAAEMGGRILGPAAFVSGDAVKVHAYAEGRRVATSDVGPDGTYSLNLPAGTYWIQVEVGDTEVAAEQVEVLPGSVQRDLRVPSPGPLR